MTEFLKAMVLVICSMLASAAIAHPQCDITRDKNNKIVRSAAMIASFKRHNPCPATGRSIGSCPGYVIDHIEPLCNCGKDVIENMQWQTVADARIKDRWERRVCREN